MKKQRKIIDVGGSSSVELNVMPFIDIFSLLCTFLLFSAVFISIGILEVQVPFLTNAAPPPEKKVPKRELVVNIHLAKDKVTLNSNFSQPPENKQKEDFPTDKKGLQDFHEALVRLKNDNVDADSATLMVDDDVVYQLMISTLDEIKLIVAKDKVENSSGEKALGKRVPGLFPKVVIGNVLL